MKLADRINLLVELGKEMSLSHCKKIQLATLQAHQENQWFTPQNSHKSIQAICNQFLQKNLLENWIKNYNIEGVEAKNIGLVLAGNIPLVGFHDLLCTFISGHKSTIKPSSKDKVLIEAVIGILNDIEPKTKPQFEIVDKLADFDAVIATGSNNTALHFEYYFREYPKIIRKNRTSVAILAANESSEELKSLAADVFDYFGLGCRNVSKIYVPDGYDLDQIFEAFYIYRHVIDHNKYKNNYDYNNAIFLLGQSKFLTNDFIILKEDESLHSRIASLHYEYYTDLQNVKRQIVNLKENIQCVSTNLALTVIQTVPLGNCQNPGLSDYADSVDTMNFLTNLN